jgi:hypothetical protein
VTSSRFHASSTEVTYTDLTEPSIPHTDPLGYRNEAGRRANACSSPENEPLRNFLQLEGAVRPNEIRNSELLLR